MKSQYKNLAIEKINKICFHSFFLPTLFASFNQAAEPEGERHVFRETKLMRKMSPVSWGPSYCNATSTPLPNQSISPPFFFWPSLTSQIFFPSNFILTIPSNVVHKLGCVSWQCPFCPKPLPDLIVLMLLNLCLG